MIVPEPPARIGEHAHPPNADPSPSAQDGHGQRLVRSLASPSHRIKETTIQQLFAIGLLLEGSRLRLERFGDRDAAERVDRAVREMNVNIRKLRGELLTDLQEGERL